MMNLRNLLLACALGASGRRRGPAGCRTGLRRRLRPDRPSGAHLRNGAGLTGTRVLLGAGILELEWLPLRVGSRPLRLPALLRRRLASRTLGARSERLVLATRSLGRTATNRRNRINAIAHRARISGAVGDVVFSRVNVAALMQLRRTLGLLDVVLFFVVAGSNLQWVATAAAAGASSIPVWIIGGVRNVRAALDRGRLSLIAPSRRRRPVRLEQARLRAVRRLHHGLDVLGEQSSVLSGAALLRGRQRALHRRHATAARSRASPAYFIAFAFAGLALATIVNVYGLQIGKWLNNAGAIARWTVTLLLVALGALRLVEVRLGDADQRRRRCAPACSSKT